MGVGMERNLERKTGRVAVVGKESRGEAKRGTEKRRIANNLLHVPTTFFQVPRKLQKKKKKKKNFFERGHNPQTVVFCQSAQNRSGLKYCTEIQKH